MIRDVLKPRRRATKTSEWSEEIIAYSPNGHWAVGPVEQLESVRLIDLRRGPKAVKSGDGEPAAISFKNRRVQCVALCDFYLAVAGEVGPVELGQLDLNGHALLSRRSLSGHVGDVKSLTFSADHKRLAAAGSGEITIWPTDTDLERLVFDEDLGEAAAVRGVELRRFGRRHGQAFFAGPKRPYAGPERTEEPSQITVIDDATSQAVAQFQTPFLVETAVAASLDRTLCAVAGKESGKKVSGEIHVFSTRPGWKPLVLRGHTDNVDSLMFDAAGKRLLSASYDATVRIWDLSDARELTVLQKQAEGSGHAEFVGEEAWIVASDPKSVRVWKPEGGEPYLSIENGPGAVGGWACSRDGSLLASGDSEYAVSLWDLKKKTKLRSLTTTRTGLAFAFSVDGSRLLTREREGVVIWSVDAGEDIFALPARGWTTDFPRFSDAVERLERDWKAILDPPTQ